MKQPLIIKWTNSSHWAMSRIITRGRPRRMGYMQMRSSCWKIKWVILARKWGILQLIRNASEVFWVKDQTSPNSVGKRIARWHDRRTIERIKWGIPWTQLTRAFTFPVCFQAQKFKLRTLAKERQQTSPKDRLHLTMKRSPLTSTLVTSPKCSNRWSKGRS